MRDAKISVIIPVYNAENTIGNILEKLIHQDYENIEIITVNDGSDDSSWKILQRFAKDDKRIVVINQKNSGASAARNAAIKIATGEYITFIDSDDDISYKLVTELAKYTGGKVDLAVCGMSINNKIVMPPNSFVSGRANIDQYVLKSLLTKNIFYGPYCKLFRTKYIIDNKIEFPIDVMYGEDTIFVLKYLGFVNNIANIRQSLYSYDFHQYGLAAKHSTNRLFRTKRLNSLKQFTFGNNSTAISKFYYLLLKTRWRISYIKSVLRTVYV